MHDRTWAFFATIGLLLLGLGGFALAMTSRHPMDGPDGELRLMHTQAGLHLAVRVNLAWLDEVLSEPRENPSVVDPSERIELEGALWRWMSDQEMLRSDSAPLLGRVESAEWFEADPERAVYFPRTGVRALTYLELKAYYPLDGPLDAVHLSWSAYPIDPVLAGPGGSPTVEVKAVLLAGPDETIVTLSSESPSHRWRLPAAIGADHLLELPAGPKTIAGPNPRMVYALVFVMGILALVLLYRHPARLVFALAGLSGLGFAYQVEVAQTPSIDESKAREVIETLHKNLYRAFDYHEREAVYDALQASVKGELLQTLYGEIHASLVVEEEGGALCRVESVQLLDATITPKGGGQPGRRQPFAATLRWRTDCVLHHWGHSHHQKQEMQAAFETAYTDAGWRILKATILESKRLPLEPEATTAKTEMQF